MRTKLTFMCRIDLNDSGFRFFWWAGSKQITGICHGFFLIIKHTMTHSVIFILRAVFVQSINSMMLHCQWSLWWWVSTADSSILSGRDLTFPVMIGVGGGRFGTSPSTLLSPSSKPHLFLLGSWGISGSRPVALPQYEGPTADQQCKQWGPTLSLQLW